MKRLILISTLVVTAFFTLQAAAAEQVFGVDWQSTPAQLRARGITLTLRKADGRLGMYETSNLPRNVSDAETYLLIFDKSEGLVKIMMIGKSYKHDPRGTRGKARFKQLDSMLRSRGYAVVRGKQVRKVGMDRRIAPNRFYECLHNPACGAWAKAYRKDHVMLLMQLRGMPDGTGFIEMDFEEQPQFDKAVANNAKTAMDKDAEAF